MSGFHPVATAATIDDVVRAVRKLAADHPAAWYEPREKDCGCLYTFGVAGPGCGCLIGQALVACDSALSVKLAALDAAGGAGVLTAFAAVGVELPDNTVEDIRMSWLCDVQAWQDRRYSWSRCVDLADSNSPILV
jgi:hypothetical protein